MKRRYDRIMEHIEVTDDMRRRVLQNLREAQARAAGEEGQEAPAPSPGGRWSAWKRYLPLALCVGGIAAGAIGNMIDRLSQGYVVDFFYFCLIDFPIFNVADCYVTVGAFALAVLVMFYYQDEDFSVFSFKKGGDRE